MVLNKLKKLLLIGALLVTTSYGGVISTSNSSEPAAPRGSNATINGSYPINSTAAVVAPRSDLLNYTRTCDYNQSITIYIMQTYDFIFKAT